MTCQECPKVSTCRKPCKEIEKILQDNGTHQIDYIRPKMSAHKRKDGNLWRELPFSSIPIDWIKKIGLETPKNTIND